MPRLFRSSLALCLAALIALTGLGLATARGQLVRGDQVLILCSGGGLVQVVLDADGQPTGDSHLCPDLAATALLPVDLPPPLAPPPRTLTRVAPAPLAPADPAPAAPVAFAARAPPALPV